MLKASYHGEKSKVYRLVITDSDLTNAYLANFWQIRYNY
jgi:hypothetical protein